jgi:hypothetical protein
MIDAERFSKYDARQFAAEWVDHLNAVFVPRLIREFASSDAVAQVVALLRENQSSNPTMKERRLLLLDRLEPLGTRVGHCGAGVSPATDSACADVASAQAAPLLDEIRQAAQVKGAGNKQTWPSEEIY